MLWSLLRSAWYQGFVRYIFSLHIRSMWETTVMHKQVSGWTVDFGPNFPESPFLELKTRKPPPPISENFRFGMTKVYSGIPPHFRKLKIWDDQSLLHNTPPISENFRFGMTKVYSGIPPHFRKLQIWDDQSLLWNTPSPHFGKLQIWDDQSLLQNTLPFQKTSDLGWPKFTPEYPPLSRKLQIWGDQSLLRNTSPFQKTSDLGWPKFTPEYPPPILENFRFGMTKVYSRIPPPPVKIVRESKSEIFRIPRVTTCGDFIQPG